jgi:putative ABC transport system substrate-binding protein
MPGDENNPDMKARISAFSQALAGLGWTDGRNVRMELRWASNDINRMRALAQELVGLQPDIILTDSTPETIALQRETRTIPIVFAFVSDPIASGIVARLMCADAQTAPDRRNRCDVVTKSRRRRNEALCNELEIAAKEDR